ncbi:hypothetical protein [Pseudomonas sp. F3-2]|uniref:hypothetical protein n=1 Tax=Pseudomonas sp. F3-2 TaxID=3141539 RepID=UPI00315C8AD9
MVTTNPELAKLIVNSAYYDMLVGELRAELNIKVLDAYEEVFATMDSASISRLDLKPDELEKIFVEDGKSLKAFSVLKYRALNNLPDEQDYLPGEEPDESDKDSNIISKGYARGFLLGNAIEFLLAKKSRNILEAYLKSSRVPKAAAYAKQVMSWIP